MTGLFPSKIHIASGSVSGFADASGDSAGSVPLSSAVLPPLSLGNFYYPAGLLAVMTQAGGATGPTFTVSLYDLATGAKVEGRQVVTDVADSSIGPDACNLAGLAPLQRGRGGFMQWYPLGAGRSALKVFLGAGVTTVSGQRRLAEDTGELHVDGLICGASPLSKTADPYFLVALGQTAPGQAQILCRRLEIQDTNYPDAPGDAPLFDIAECWSQEYTAAFWLNRPDTCLAAQNVPATMALDPGIVALFGNWAAPEPHPAVSDPRLALLALDGTPLWSHEFGCGRAHGMTVNQFGDIFVTGTADIVNGGPFLICRYGVNQFGQTQARVQHGEGGLGNYASDPEATHVVTPTWNGSRLIVQDHGPESTRFFIYDRNLAMKGSFTVSAAPCAGLRWRGSIASSTWWGEAY